MADPRRKSASSMSTGVAVMKQTSMNCAECRRLKLKCDRQIPCSACVRRGCKDLCPDGVKQPRRSAVEIRVTEKLNKRLQHLESLLTSHGVSVPSIDDGQDDDEDTSSLNQGDDSPRRKRQRQSTPRRYRYDDQPQSQSRTGNRPRIDSRPVSYSRNEINTSTQSQSQSQRDGGEDNISPFSPEKFWDRPQSRPSSAFSDNDRPTPHGNGKDDQARSSDGVEQSHGTLVIGSSGRSRYLGPTAGTEWLKNQEVGDTRSPSPAHSPRPLGSTSTSPPGIPSPVRLHSPDPQVEQHHHRHHHHTPHHHHHHHHHNHDHLAFVTAFPFAPPRESLSLDELITHLPNKEDAGILVDCYYRYYAWLHDVAPRSSFKPIFDKLYSSTPPSSSAIPPQQLALVYMILAMGTLFNLELPPNDETAEEFLALSKGCLMKGDFLNNNTIAGVRTLITMGHYHLETEKGRNGDSAWPIWGLAMRIVVAMGLHRDGAKWNLPEEVVEERRQVFWECHTIEIFQANCFSRPSSLIPKYIDTKFPSALAVNETLGESKSFGALTFELCQISARILDVGMTVHHNPYSAVQELYSQLCSFERQVPFSLRCRVASMALPSIYPDPEQARQQSPEVSRKHLHQTFQQYTIALNVSEQVLHLQRAYFVLAMHDLPVDPTRSIYGHSYLAVVERCGVLVQIVASLYELFPAISARHWFFWYHLFTAAVCLGTLILKSPSSVLAPYALSQIDQAISTYSQLIKSGASKSIIENHDWLVRLRHRAAKKMEAAEGVLNASVNGIGEENVEGEGEDVELLGWRTRLIQRVPTGTKASYITNKNKQKQQQPQQPHAVVGVGIEIGELLGLPPTSSSSSSSAIPTSMPDLSQQQMMHQHHQHHHPTSTNQNQNVLPRWDAVQNTSTNTIMDIPNINMNMNMNMNGSLDSTDQLLHQFWDPMMMPDAARLASENWWSWDLSLDQSQSQAQSHAHGQGQGQGNPR